MEQCLVAAKTPQEGRMLCMTLIAAIGLVLNAVTRSKTRHAPGRQRGAQTNKAGDAFFLPAAAADMFMVEGMLRPWNDDV